MNKAELKKVLRPLIKECVKEIIFEEGTLSTIVSEVLKGASGKQDLKESRSSRLETDKEANLRLQKRQSVLQENRKKMLDAIGKGSYNGVDLFEGTTPTQSPRNPGTSTSKALEGVSPSDPGVDISNFGLPQGLWKKLSGN